MSTFSPGPWRRGGKAVEKHDDQGNFLEWEEYKEGTDIWDANGEPVLVIADFFDGSDIDFIAAAPDMYSLLNQIAESGSFIDEDLYALLARIDSKG